MFPPPCDELGELRCGHQFLLRLVKVPKLGLIVRCVYCVVTWPAYHDDIRRIVFEVFISVLCPRLWDKVVPRKRRNTAACFAYAFVFFHNIIFYYESLKLAITEDDYHSVKISLSQLFPNLPSELDDHDISVFRSHMYLLKTIAKLISFKKIFSKIC